MDRARLELLRQRARRGETARDELRGRYRNRVPLSDDIDERAKGVRKTVVGGVKIRLSPSISGESFSLKRYRELGHKITSAMVDAINAGKPYDRWTVTAAAGPKKIDAVEPT